MSLRDPLPRYLLEKVQITSTVVFAALFSLVFMLISIPFSHNIWFELSLTESFAFTVVFFLVATLVVVTSKVIMYRNREKYPLTYGSYILWCLVECIVISALYTLATLQGMRLGILNLGDMSAQRLFCSAMVYVLVSLGVPYVVAGQYFAINDKNNTIRLLNYGNVVTDTELQPQEEKKISLFDSSGEMKLSVNLRNLYYIESDDNYIRVWYASASGEMKMYMLRCKLKTVEESFKDSDLMRCHRKYIVNMSKVSVLTRDRNGFVLELDGAGIEPLPVSKTYEESILNRFNER